jgi:hypothetical protein
MRLLVMAVGKVTSPNVHPRRTPPWGRSLVSPGGLRSRDQGRRAGGRKGSGPPAVKGADDAIEAKAAQGRPPGERIPLRPMERMTERP